LEKLIPDELVSALQIQISHEKYNANLYLFIAGFLKNKGLDELGKFFLNQHDEETKHSLMIYELLTDLDAPVVIPEIDEVDLSFNSIMDIANAYLDREIATTDSLNEIKKLSIDKDGPIVEEFMRDMIKLQRNEYAEATDFEDKAELCGEDWSKVLLWDVSLK
jgi:ferritin